MSLCRQKQRWKYQRAAGLQTDNSQLTFLFIENDRRGNFSAAVFEDFPAIDTNLGKVMENIPGRIYNLYNCAQA